MPEGPDRIDGACGLEELVAGALRHLESLRYSKGTISNYAGTWKSYVRFAAVRGVTDRFSQEIADTFLAEQGVSLAGPAPQSRARHLRAAMRILCEFEFSRCFHRRRGSAAAKCAFPAMNDAIATYTRYCSRKLRLSPHTMRDRLRTITRFLQQLEARGHVAPGSMTGTEIQVFARSRAHHVQTTICREMTALRSFLRAGFALGFIFHDLSEHVPRVSSRRYGRLPSVWKPCDVEAMLRAVDRGSPVGKRDYAIVLLAAKLGLRAGDIRSLRLDDLNWDQAIIRFRQNKTGKLLELPLTDEVAAGLIDYLRHARPAVDHREVFVRLKAPFVPFGRMTNFYPIITKYRRLAGVRLQAGSRRGLHSLRHSLATALLADGVPIEQISPILGHASIDTTMTYTRVDIAALRSASLEPDGGVDKVNHE